MLKYCFLYLIILSIPTTCFPQDTAFNKFDQNGRKTGFWKGHYENGKLKYSGYFENDKPIGEMKKYYPGGLLQSIMVFDKTSRYSYTKLFDENGKLIAEGKYFGKIKDSTWNYYSSVDGRLVLSEKFYLGKRTGTSSKYYPNGNASELIEWENDSENGKWEQFYENGDMRLKCSYLEGKRNGYFQSFYPGGILSIEGEYQNGVMNGKWTYYKENGDKDYCIEYSMGKMLPNDEYERRTREFSKKVEDVIEDFPEPK